MMLMMMLLCMVMEMEVGRVIDVLHGGFAWCCLPHLSFVDMHWMSLNWRFHGCGRDELVRGSMG